MAKRHGATGKEAYHHGDLRDALVGATRTLIEQKGAPGFSVADAARMVGVSTAAPYRHFADRTAMLMAVAADGMARLGQDFDDAVQGHDPGSLAAISALGRAYVDFAVAEPGVFRLMFANHVEPDDNLVAAGDACFGHLLTQVAAFHGGDLDDQALRIAALPLWTFVHGVAALAIDGKLERSGVSLPSGPMIDLATARLLGPSPFDPTRSRQS